MQHRKLATIIFTDIAGYTFIISKNEKFKYTSGMFVPLADALRKYGTAKIECWLSEQNGITEVYCEINSIKDPGIISRIFVKEITNETILSIRE